MGTVTAGYQRGRIQDESMHYEMLKHTGELPIIGVNTFRNPHGDAVQDKLELARSTDVAIVWPHPLALPVPAVSMRPELA